MLNSRKKLATMAAAIAMVSCMSVTAFAGSQSLNTKYYGTLYGNLTSRGAYTTTVTKNPDKAQLTITGSIQDINGNTLKSQPMIKSARGAKSYKFNFSSIPSKAYALFGTHGVQGGSSYGAQAIYTYTRA